MAQTHSSPTYYEILSIPSDIQLTPVLLKKAYHRTLLLHHPDKQSSVPSDIKPQFTVDQITTAYTILSTPQLCREYEKNIAAPASIAVSEEKVLQTVDLDDFDYDEERERWTRACRCGEEEGFVITEEDMMAGDDVVGCCGCSLWLKVGYEVIYENDVEVDKKEEERKS